MVPRLSSHRYHRGSFPSRDHFLAILDYNIGTRNPLYTWAQFRLCKTPSMVSPVNRTFSWILSELLLSHTAVIHILQISTLSFLFTISTSCHVLFNRRHRALHLLDFYTPNYVTQTLAPAIHYRHSPVKYSNVPYLVYFNFSL